MELPTAIDWSFSLSDLLVYIMGALLTGAGILITYQKRQIREVKNQLSDKKYNLYNEVLSMFFDILKQKDNINQDKIAKEVGKRLFDVKKELLLYAPDNVLEKFIQWSRYVNNNPTEDIRHFLIFIDLMALIRKDMGHPKTSFRQDDFWKLIMTTDVDIALMKAKIKELNQQN